MRKCGARLQAKTLMVAQLDPDQSHSPCGRFTRDGEPTVDEPDNEHEQREEKHRRKDRKRQDQDTQDTNEDGVKEPRDCTLYQDAIVELWLCRGIGEAKGGGHVGALSIKNMGEAAPYLGPPQGEVRQARSRRRLLPLGHQLRGRP